MSEAERLREPYTPTLAIHPLSRVEIEMWSSQNLQLISVTFERTAVPSSYSRELQFVMGSLGMASRIPDDSSIPMTDE